MAKEDAVGMHASLYRSILACVASNDQTSECWRINHALLLWVVDTQSHCHGYKKAQALYTVLIDGCVCALLLV